MLSLCYAALPFVSTLVLDLVIRPDRVCIGCRRGQQLSRAPVKTEVSSYTPFQLLLLLYN